MESSGNLMKKLITSAALLFLFVLLSIAGQSRAQDTAVSEAVKEQIEMLQSGSAKQKIIAARNLGGMGAEALPSVQYLIELLDSHERHRSLLKKILNVVTVFGNFGPYVSDECRQSLVRIGKPAVLPLSDALLNHPRSGVRRNVAVALGEIADVESVDSLIAALRTDADYEVRSCSAEALGKMSERWLIDLLGNAVQALIEALKSEDPNVRQKAAYALGELEALDAVPSLIELLQAYGKESDAGQALKKITGQRLGDDPQKWQEWWDKNRPE
jgi:HEAT repeat protein